MPHGKLELSAFIKQKKVEDVAENEKQLLVCVDENKVFYYKTYFIIPLKFYQ